LRDSLLPRHRLGGAGTPGCPVNNRFRISTIWLTQNNGRSLAQPALDNISEFTVADLPGALRSFLHAQHRRQPVTIKTIECAIVDRAWENGWVKPEIPTRKTGKKIAVIGSGSGGNGLRAAARARRLRPRRKISASAR